MDRFNPGDVDIDLVALRIGHASPPEAFEFPGVARLDPAASQ
jgi:hypothetical protein